MNYNQQKSWSAENLFHHKTVVGSLGKDVLYDSGVDPGFQVRGAHLKKLRRAEGGANIFGIFRVKNHDLTPKNHFFLQF